MHFQATYKNEEDQIKNEGERVVTTFLRCKSMGIFPDIQGLITPQSEVGSGRNSNSFKLS